jgi:hypothetical protein
MSETRSVAGTTTTTLDRGCLSQFFELLMIGCRGAIQADHHGQIRLAGHVPTVLHMADLARFVVTDGDSVEFSFQNREKTLDLAFDAEALETFVRLGFVALEEMKRLRAPD